MIPLIFLRFQPFQNVHLKAEQVEIDTGFNPIATVVAASADTGIMKISHFAALRENRLHEDAQIAPHPLTSEEIAALSRKQITSPLR